LGGKNDCGHIELPFAKKILSSLLATLLVGDKGHRACTKDLLATLTENSLS